MRQGQHKSRHRGRSQQRRQGSSTNRIFESNGPDVKVRGTAQTVADKYLQLARDSISSGDNVTAESYFQHAEHYLRVIAATQAQQQQQQQQQQQKQSNASGGASNPDSDAGTPEASAANKPEDVPGSGPQPDLKEASADKESDKEPGGSFDGQTPDFLAKSANDDGKSEKPKRNRRSPTRSSRSKANGDDGGNTDVTADADDTAPESATEASSDAEAVAS